MAVEDDDKLFGALMLLVDATAESGLDPRQYGRLAQVFVWAMDCRMLELEVTPDPRPVNTGEVIRPASNLRLVTPKESAIRAAAEGIRAGIETCLPPTEEAAWGDDDHRCG